MRPRVKMSDQHDQLNTCVMKSRMINKVDYLKTSDFLIRI
jgi:hypothetical protein